MNKRSLLKILAIVFFSGIILNAKSIDMVDFPKDKQKVLLLSSSGYKNTGYLNHALPWLKEFVKKII